MKHFFLLILIFASLASASIPSDENYTPGGFANDLPLRESLNIFVPNTWEVRAPRSVLSKKVSWVGDIGWYDILKKISINYKIDLILDKSNNVITLLNSDPVNPQGSIIEHDATASITDPLAPVAIIPSKKHYPPVVLPPLPALALAPLPAKEMSFLDAIKKKTQSLFSDEPLPTSIEITKKPLIARNHVPILAKLFKSLGLKTRVISAYKVYKKTDNTVSFTFSYEDLSLPSKQQINSYMVFNGVEVYSPILVFPADMEISKLWYKSNYIHPSLNGKPLIRPISSYTTQHIANIKSKGIRMPPKISTIPSFLERKEFVAKKGEMLSETIHRWSKGEGVSVVWDPSTDFKITQQLRFFKNYLESVKSMLLFYNSTLTPLQTRFFIKNKTLLVQNLQIIYRKIYDK
jgi:hypothetical protein